MQMAGFNANNWKLSRVSQVLSFYSATTAKRRRCTIVVGTQVTAPSNASKNTGTVNISACVVANAREHAHVLSCT